VENGKAKEIYENPLHPYTRKLIECLPEKYKKGERIKTIEGEVPSFKNLPSGCPFFQRCDYKMKICEERIPGEINFGNRILRCFKYGNTLES
jgi:oligopeptide/dipeptide ABC transporter ATP-binding protein